jgi:mannosylglycoprotein endo-beta-mannosidase
MATSFGCVVSSFPQTYLGLPLSTHKLRFADFAPIISKSDKRLSGWRGRFLPIGGRLILVNSVLTSMISHAMGAGLLPVGVIEAIDKRRRAFLWTGNETCNGGQCKVAWPDVCTPKALGGLGILSIPAQNSALLAKFLTKLHSDSTAPWACWFRRMYGWGASRDLGDHHYLDTPVWKDILAGLDTFRSISKVVVGNGNSTAFWLDLWLGSTPFYIRFPCLFSHSIRPHANVASILRSGLPLNLGPRLSTAAVTELRVLTSEFSSLELRDNPDFRDSRLNNKKLSNKSFYVNSFRHLQTDELAVGIWRSAAPLKCKVFCWLARRWRLQTNARRFRHHLSTSATCLSCPEDEDIDHLLLLCPRAQEVWHFFHNNFGSRGVAHFTDIWLARDHSYEEATINTAIAWTIWKRRNALAFNGIVEDLSLASRRCIEDVRLWAYRCNTPSSADALNFWCNSYDPP